MKVSPVKKWHALFDRAGIEFRCPGCKSTHAIPTDAKGWKFNGNLDSPTITPSILVRRKRSITDAEAERILNGEKLEIPTEICHSYITDGLIQFCGDSTHSLASNTVALPEWTDEKNQGES
jgi:hypothetical protein